VDDTRCPHSILSAFKPARGPLTTEDNEGKRTEEQRRVDTLIHCLLLGRAITQIINLVGRTHKLYELAAAARSEQKQANSWIHLAPNRDFPGQRNTE